MSLEEDKKDAARETRAALVAIRVALAEFPDDELTEQNVLNLIRTCRNKLNVLSTSLPFLPRQGESYDKARIADTLLSVNGSGPR